MTIYSKGPVRQKIGLALGGGSARGWAHIGVIRELAKIGIEADIVCGTSIGALVGAAHVSGHLDMLEKWIRRLDKKEIIKYLDITLLMGGGFVEGKRLIDFFRKGMGDISIEDLPKPFAAVATDLATGQEVWFREGSLMDAIRASIALPGIFTPAKLDDRWLVDGGLVNPVPVSLCRAMGAELVIAVNLNGEIVGRHLSRLPRGGNKDRQTSVEATLLDKLSMQIRNRANSFVSHLFESGVRSPGLFDVLASSINIMQHQITRSRMAGDPPDVVLAPRLARIGLLEFDRAEEAIEEGRGSVRRMLPVLQDLLAVNDPATGLLAQDK